MVESLGNATLGTILVLLVDRRFLLVVVELTAVRLRGQRRRILLTLDSVLAVTELVEKDVVGGHGPRRRERVSRIGPDRRGLEIRVVLDGRIGALAGARAASEVCLLYTSPSPRDS